MPSPPSPKSFNVCNSSSRTDKAASPLSFIWMFSILLDLIPDMCVSIQTHARTQTHTLQCSCPHEKSLLGFNGSWQPCKCLQYPGIAERKSSQASKFGQRRAKWLENETCCNEACTNAGSGSLLAHGSSVGAGSRAESGFGGKFRELLVNFFKIFLHNSSRTK